MVVKALTSDGKVPVTLRFDPDCYELLRRYAFEVGQTNNMAAVSIVCDFLGYWPDGDGDGGKGSTEEE